MPILLFGSSLDSSTKKTLPKLDTLWQNFLDPRMFYNWFYFKAVKCKLQKKHAGAELTIGKISSHKHIKYKDATQNKKISLRPKVKYFYRLSQTLYFITCS